MAAWTPEELSTIERTDEVEISSLRRDGTLRAPRIVWAVRLGDDIYIRSVNGTSAAWFRGVQTRHEGRIEADGVGRDVSFAEADPDIDDQVDAAYRDKYRRYGSPVRSITNAQARGTTLKLVPRS